MEYLDNGSVVPAREYSATFANDLRETIVSQILDQRELVRGQLDNESLTCKLPSGTQLLDFVELKATDEPNEFEVNLKIPARENDDKGFQVTFIYAPPR